MFILSKWRFLFIIFVLVKTIKAVSKLILSAVMRICKETEFTLKSDENTIFSHRVLPRIDWHSTKNYGLRNTLSQASDSADQNNSPASIDCQIHDLPLGKRVIVRHLNQYEVVANFFDVARGDSSDFQPTKVHVESTSEPVSIKLENNLGAKIQWASTPLDNVATTSKHKKFIHETNANKTSVESTGRLKNENQVIKKSKTKISNASVGGSSFKTDTSDGTDKLNEPDNSDNILSGSGSTNMPQQISKCSLKSQSSEVKTFCTKLNEQNNSENIFTGSAPTNVHQQIFNCSLESQSPDAEEPRHKLNKPNTRNEIAENVPLNVPQQIIQCSLKSSSPNPEELSHKNESKTIESNEKQDFKGNEDTSYLHEFKQKAVEGDFNASGDGLAGSIQGNPMITIKDENRVFMEVSDESDHQRNPTTSTKSRIEIAKSLINDYFDEVKLNLTSVYDERQPSINIAKHENTVVYPNMVETNEASSQFVDCAVNTDETISQFDECSGTDSSPQLTKENINVFKNVHTEVNDMGKRYINFMIAVRPKLYDIERKIRKLCEAHYCHSKMNSDKLKEIRMRLQDICLNSERVNGPTYHSNIEEYEKEIIGILVETQRYISTNINNPNRIKRITYLKQLAQNLAAKRHRLNKTT